MVDLTILIPHLPHSDVGPNARKHHFARNNAMQGAKDEMVAELRSQGGVQDPLWNRVEIQFVFHCKDKRRRDVDNLIACCKPWIDALTGEVIPDDSVDYVPKVSGEFVRDSESFTEVTIKQLS